MCIAALTSYRKEEADAPEESSSFSRCFLSGEAKLIRNVELLGDSQYWKTTYSNLDTQLTRA